MYVMLYSQDGRTSLDLAVERGHNETVQLLKTYQAKVRCTSDEQLYRQIKPYIYVLLGTVNKPATFVQHSGLFAYNH